MSRGWYESVIQIFERCLKGLQATRALYNKEYVIRENTINLLIFSKTNKFGNHIFKHEVLDNHIYSYDTKIPQTN